MKRPKLSAPGSHRKFRFARPFAICLAIYAYATWPVTPATPAPSELTEIVGLPRYVNTSSVDISGIAFTVNGTVLNCDLWSLSGSGGCNFSDIRLNPKQPVRATYFWQPTRMWWHYKVLNSVEQDGKTIISPERMRDWYARDYAGQWDRYYFFMGLGILAVCALAGFDLWVISVLRRSQNLEQRGGME